MVVLENQKVYPPLTKETNDVNKPLSQVQSNRLLFFYQLLLIMLLFVFYVQSTRSILWTFMLA
jgi:hypothetical protein